MEHAVRDAVRTFLFSLTLRIRDPMGAQISSHTVCLRQSSGIMRCKPIGMHVLEWLMAFHEVTRCLQL